VAARGVGGIFYRGGMLESALPVALVPSTDLGRARAFYEGALGLPVQDLNSFACVFGAGPIRLRVTLVGELAPQPFTVFGWEVAGIHETIAGLARRGVEFVRYESMDQDTAGVWTAPGGAQVAWFRDPDGNVLSLTQLPG